MSVRREAVFFVADFDAGLDYAELDGAVPPRTVRALESRLFVYPDHVDSSTATVHGYPGVILPADPEAPYASFVGRMVSTRPEITLIAPTRPTKDQLLGLPSTLNWE